jgi:hypothetical protein
MEGPVRWIVLFGIVLARTGTGVEPARTGALEVRTGPGGARAPRAVGAAEKTTFHVETRGNGRGWRNPPGAL